MRLRLNALNARTDFIYRKRRLSHADRKRIAKLLHNHAVLSDRADRFSKLLNCLVEKERNIADFVIPAHGKTDRQVAFTLRNIFKSFRR